MKLFYSLALVGALLASVANAQTWPAATRSSKFSVRSAPAITSVTTAVATGVDDTTANLDVLLTATTPTSLNLIAKLDNGLIVSTSGVPADTTPRTYRFTAPLNYQIITVSVTTALANNTVSASLINSKQ